MSLAGERLDVGVGRGRCSGRPTPRRARRRAARPARGRAGCRARAGRGPAARPASSTARDCSASNAPLLAEHVDPARVRRAGGEHLAADELDVVVGAALVLGGHDVGAEERHVVGELARRPRTARASVADVEPVAGLDLEVRDARRAAPRRGGARGERAQLLVAEAARVASVVTRIPPAAYGAPAIRAANSSPRSPANTRCVWLSTKPGMTQRPPASMRSSACAPGALDRGDAAVLDARARRRGRPERAFAELGVVGDQQADVVDDQRAHRDAPRASSAPRRARACARRARSSGRRP